MGKMITKSEYDRMLSAMSKRVGMLENQCNRKAILGEILEIGGITVEPELTLGDEIIHSVVLYPNYPGAVWSSGLRGSTGVDAVSNVDRHYYEGLSSEAYLDAYAIALKWQVPNDFGRWCDLNAILIEFRTESGTYLNSHVSVTVGSVGSSMHRVSTEWAAIVFSGEQLSEFRPGDIMDLELVMQSRNNYYARIGAVKFNYVPLTEGK